MWRALAGAENRWVHGLPWLSYVTLSAKSLELKCSREPARGTLGTYTKVGSSLTYLELQRDGSRAAKHVGAKYIGELWRKAAARVHLQGMQQGENFIHPSSLRRSGLQRLQSSAEVGCDAGCCF